MTIKMVHTHVIMNLVAGWNRLLLLCNENEVFGTDELRTNKVYVKPGPLDSTKCRVRIVTTSTEVTGDQP